MAYWKGKHSDSENSSPFKISAEKVVEAQARLDKAELGFREPGWTKAARGILAGGKQIAALMGQGQDNNNNKNTNPKHGEDDHLCTATNCPDFK